MFPVLFWMVYLIVGLLLGFFYFSILWLTVRHIQSAKHPIVFTLSSFFGRMLITIGAFYLITTSGNWQGLVASLLGFLIIRFILIKRWGPQERFSRLGLKKASES